jgi:hypothetical protein
MDRRGFLTGAAMAAVGAGRQADGAEGAGLRLRVEEGDVYVRCGQRALCRYRHRPVEGPPGTDPIQTRSGYLHPVYAPNGAQVTNDYSPDHMHQRGVFSAWTKTEIALDGEVLHPDFWNLHLKSGRVRSASVAVRDPAGERPGFQALHLFEARHRDTWVPVLEDRWEVRFPRQPVKDPEAPDAAFLIDITSHQRPRISVQLPKYHYGGMAVRGSGEWAKGSAMKVVTSEGKDRAGADGAKARWVDMNGPIGGKSAGIALLEHPSNPMAPNAVRMHPDMPYYVFALPQAGPLTLEAGKDYVFRYRVVAHNGAADPARLDSFWRDFSAASGG